MINIMDIMRSNAIVNENMCGLAHCIKMFIKFYIEKYSPFSV